MQIIIIRMIILFIWHTIEMENYARFEKHSWLIPKYSSPKFLKPKYVRDPEF